MAYSNRFTLLIVFISIVFSAILLDKIAAGEFVCPDGWIARKEACIGIFDDEETWEGARKSCQGVGGDLYTMETRSKRFWISRQLKLKYKSHETMFWIGLSKTDGQFHWINGEYQNSTFPTWSSGSVNPLQSGSCVAFNGKKWNAVQCQQNTSYICEKPAIEPCEVDWQRHNDFCYKVDSNLQHATNWFQSRDECGKMGADLASIADAEENSFLTKLLNQNKGVFWIGLNDLDGDVFRWSDNTPLSFLSWDQRHMPSHKINKRCVALQPKGIWAVAGCSKNFRSVCKKRSKLHTATNPKADTSLTRPVTSGGCPTGFTTVGGSSRCYYVGGQEESQRKSFRDANAECNRGTPNSRLASVHSRVDQNLVMTLVANLNVSAWVGLRSYAGAEAKFYWLDGSNSITPMTFGNWGKQDVHTKHDEECVTMQTDKGMEGKWQKTKCLETRPYVCEYSRDPVFPLCNQTNTGCPTDYHPFRNSCYKFVDSPKSWNNATVTCNQDGGHLVRIGDRFEASFVELLMDHHSNATSWIDLNDKLKVNVNKNRGDLFAWSDGSALTYNDWDLAFNSPTIQGSGDCVMHQYSQGWKLSGCETMQPFVCETDHDEPRVGRLFGAC